ncbi:aldehyde dehydrogenase family protein [Salinisphaera sp.]|uniref:aldehyde dehydrogenase family protein n=1 Tax=Salinisphaera sp. TaxID=1914330 RepID=UPI002D79066A|nr:aldehyde dehydrogenase family protein [Salinisphaera sp.]HET7313394.1 aldehyde dehydrogenase family protein [Salinisphaera sp.]
MNEVALRIGTALRGAAHGATFERRNPAGGDVVTRAAAAGAADANAAAEAAGQAFESWSQTGPGVRRARLAAAADEIEARAEAFMQAMIDETGSTAAWAGFNVQVAASMLREAAALTTQIRGETIPSDVPGSLAMSLRVPCGPVLGIAPWNAPVILGVRAIATALACGNTVVLKASERCPMVHHLIGEALVAADLGDGIVNVVHNAPDAAADVVTALIEHPAIARVNFTGSTRVGRLIGESAARLGKPALLELGGKAPLVVAHDADLEAAVDATVFGAFFHQGQICMATERVVVAASIADAFVGRLAARVAELKAGDPRREATPLGTLIGESARRHCNALIADATGLGAKTLTGGEAETVIMQPTVLDHVTPAMRAYHEESFGPIVTVVRAADDEDALVAIANDTEYGLAAAIFSDNGARALRIARRIRSGICHINAPTVHDEAQMPFGGVKASGHGRFGGQAGIAEFTDLRWITTQTGPRRYPI